MDCRTHDSPRVEASGPGAPSGLQLLFVAYPFWDDDRVTCLAPAHALREGGPVAPACAALGQAGVPLDQLFLDNNHLTVEGNRRVAEALASSILEQGWLTP